MATVLGLDIGSNSIGWALIDNENKRIAAAGVRVFQEGVNRDTKGAEISKHASRRTARGARRSRQRRNYRKDKLMRLLTRKGLLPQDDKEVRVLYHINQRRGFLSNRKCGKSKDDGVVIKSATAIQEAMQKNDSRTLG
jgi:CRISPR-associated endonuclease Csn1